MSPGLPKKAECLTLHPSFTQKARPARKRLVKMSIECVTSRWPLLMLTWSVEWTTQKTEFARFSDHLVWIWALVLLTFVFTRKWKVVDIHEAMRWNANANTVTLPRALSQSVMLCSVDLSWDLATRKGPRLCLFSHCSLLPCRSVRRKAEACGNRRRRKAGSKHLTW